MELKQSEYYWLNAPAIDPDEPLMIGQFSKTVPGYGSDRWYIGGKFYNAGSGIDPIKRIPQPKIKR